MATRGLSFFPPKGKCVSLCRSIALDLKSADKEEFVSYEGR